MDDPQHGMNPGWPGRGKGMGKPTPRPPPPPRAAGKGMFYRPVRVELTVGGVPMVGYRQGIPGVDYSIELTMRNPDQPAPRLAAEPPIVGKMGTTATGPSSASAVAASASSRAPTVVLQRKILGLQAQVQGLTQLNTRPLRLVHQVLLQRKIRPLRPVHHDWGLWLKLRVMPDGRRVIYRDPREPPTSSATGPAPKWSQKEAEAEDLTVEETSSDVEVVSPKKVMRKDGSHGASWCRTTC